MTVRKISRYVAIMLVRRPNIHYSGKVFFFHLCVSVGNITRTWFYTSVSLIMFLLQWALACCVQIFLLQLLVRLPGSETGPLSHF